MKQVLCTENILRIKSRLKEGYDIDGAKTEEQPDMEESLASIIEKNNFISLDNLTLTEQSKEVAVYISGYIAMKVCSTIGECCSHLQFGECDNSDGLKSPSQVIWNHFCQSFAMIDASDIEVILKNSLPSRVAAEHIQRLKLLQRGWHVAIMSSRHQTRPRGLFEMCF